MIGRAAVTAIAGWILAVPLAAFFAFVGWNKAFAPLAELARHGAWTVHLPPWLGRAVGGSELACAALLLVPGRLRRIAALVLVANQACAAAVHLAHGEVAALPQNALLLALLIALAWLGRSPTFQGVSP